MCILSVNEIKALDLIKSNPRDLTSRGHLLINANIQALIKKGFVVYDCKRHVGYRLVSRKVQFMYFDRFDICEAYYLYSLLWAGSSHYIDRIASRLAAMKFKPRPSLRRCSDLNDNALEIYNRLVLNSEG